MIVRAVPLAEAVRAALDGEIVHAASISAIFLLSHRLKA